MSVVKYLGINKIVETSDSPTILELSINNKIPHLHECGGNGRCTTCRVRVVNGMGNLTAPTQAEKKIAEERKWDPTIRLGCQTIVKGDVELQRLIWSNAEVSMLQLETISDNIGEERRVAILICDMRNFTNITSSQLKFDMVHMLNRFYTILGDPILMNNGIIYKYIGDEIIGLFGTSGGGAEKNCTDAIRAALGMRYALARLNKWELKDFGTEFKIGIGVHFGQAYMGHAGHPKFRQFTVIGDPINVTKRIEEQTKKVGEDILISEAVFKNLPQNLLHVNDLHAVQLKGKEQQIQLFGVNGFQKTDTHLELQISLNELLKNEADFVDRFYNKVFTAAPSVRQLFKTNMELQGRLLTHMLSGIVYSLSRPESLVMGLKALGRSHKKYGVLPEHYPVVKKYLLETIEEELGELYTPRAKEAWETAVSLVIEKCKDSVENL